jgi:hypothetical protein
MINKDINTKIKEGKVSDPSLNPDKDLKKDKKQAIKKAKTITTTKSRELVVDYNTPIYTVYINMKLDYNNKRICLNILNNRGIRAYIKDETIICGKFYDKQKALILISKISKIGYISSIK